MSNYEVQWKRGRIRWRNRNNDTATRWLDLTVSEARKRVELADLLQKALDYEDSHDSGWRTME